MATATNERTVDLPTLVAIAVLAYAISNVVHEGGGHGGACLLAGGKPVELNAVYFQCAEGSLSGAGERWLSAGGTLANFAVAAAVSLASRRRGPTPLGYFAWLLVTISLLQGTGYLLFSGLMGVGDWANVVDGLAPAALYRALLAVVGGVGYVLSIRHALRTLAPFLGPSEGRVARATRLTLVPYLAGGALYCAAGLFNPASPMLVLSSAAAASFGGTSALAWAANLVRNERRFPLASSELVLPRSAALVGAAALVALGFVLVLGRSIHF